MEQENVGSNPAQVVPSSVALTSQVRFQLSTAPPHSLIRMNQEQAVDISEIDDAISLLRETKTEIGILKDIKIMIYKEKFTKKYILIYPLMLLKSSIDIRPPSNLGIGNFVVIMNPILMNKIRTGRERSPSPTTPILGPMNLIIWNCRGGNGAEFRRKFRALIDWHKHHW